MPFKLTHGKSGYFVYDPITKKHFSNSGLSKKTAAKQRLAIALSESKKSGKPVGYYLI